MRKALTLLTLCLSITVLCSCAATSVTLSFKSIMPVNQLESEADGGSRVTEVRIFQLNDDAAFKQATADAIWTDAKEALGDSLIKVEAGESIFPEEKAQAQGNQVVIDPLDANTRFIGVLALFSDTDDGERKVVVPLDQADDVLFELTGYHITIKSE